MARRIDNVVIIVSLAGLVSCSGGPWPDADQDRFLEECSAEGGSRSYCSCYLEKAMEYYPNATDAEQMDFETAVELSKDCKE